VARRGDPEPLRENVWQEGCLNGWGRDGHRGQELLPRWGLMGYLWWMAIEGHCKRHVIQRSHALTTPPLPHLPHPHPTPLTPRGLPGGAGAALCRGG
jgi:hypothetical protein